ncbi:hypothetical protein [Micromonospora sp. NPDC005652]|uniref:hypothetical protein n=1 Tax=Micromonospora sp. NPDC005652 TaxID=3157046 RepID=UPI0033F285AF
MERGKQGETTCVVVAGDRGPETRTTYTPTQDELRNFEAFVWRYRVRYRFQTTFGRGEGWYHVGFHAQMTDARLAEVIQSLEEWLSRTPSAGGDRLVAGSVTVVDYRAIA